MSYNKEMGFTIGAITDYGLASLTSDSYDDPPDERESGASISRIISTYYFTQFDSSELVRLISAAVPERDLKIIKLVCMEEIDWIDFYRVFGTRGQLLDLLGQMMNKLIGRLKYLDCEDDHHDLFPPALELVVQIAIHLEATDRLRPLYYHLETRGYCQLCYETGYDPHKCFLPEILEPFLNPNIKY